MMVLAGMHMRHAAGAWPIVVIVGMFVLVVACVAIAVLARRRSPVTEGSGAAGRFDSYTPHAGGSGFSADGYAYGPEGFGDTAELDAGILAMIRQKGEPMPQFEVAENMGVDLDALASRLADMERREMLRRTWDTDRATYVVQVFSK